MAGGFLCATVTAPLDYRNPSGPKIKLAVVEHVATGSAHPAASSSTGRPRRGRHSTAPVMDRVLPEGAAARVRHRELGPAGVRREHRGQVLPERGRGKRVPRQDAPSSPWAGASSAPTSAAGASSARSAPRGTARCSGTSRPRTPPATWTCCARTLGQPKLNYLGISYGTFLGATYANLFPRRVGQAGAGRERPARGLDQRRPAEPPAERVPAHRQRHGAARTLAAFLRICGQRSTQDCAFSAGSPAATRAKWDALLAHLRRAPITSAARPSPTSRSSPHSATRSTSCSPTSRR